MLKKEGLLPSLWSSPQTPWKMMGKFYRERVRPVSWMCYLHGMWQNGSCLLLSHLLGQFLPAAVGMRNNMVTVLLQLPLIELLIGELEDRSMWPGVGRWCLSLQVNYHFHELRKTGRRAKAALSLSIHRHSCFTTDINWHFFGSAILKTGTVAYFTTSGELV